MTLTVVIGPYYYNSEIKLLNAYKIYFSAKISSEYFFDLDLLLIRIRYSLSRFCKSRVLKIRDDMDVITYLLELKNA